ncbi:MAG: phytanoyl-CoA dioxygenase family protein [Actinomycetota bacterium]|nr:phytanoyl-CoA dioxygenase family protein [Actinomycetota bacterium]
MWSFKRRSGVREAGGTAVADEPQFEEYEGSDDALFAEIERLTARNRSARSAEIEHRLVRLRHLAGVRAMDRAPANPAHPQPDFGRLPEGPGLPEFGRDDVTPELLRAGILRHGCLLVRELIFRDQALAFAQQIDRAFTERERHDQGEAVTDGYYAELGPHPRFNPDVGRPWVKEGGGVLASDSPMLSFELGELFESAGIRWLASTYLGEPALMSLQKTTLRKAEPWVGGAWHQDGAFMGPVRSLNLWLSLSRCGDEAPGLDIVPRRLDYLVTRKTEEAVFDMQVSQIKAREAAGEVGILRPIFEPGDALLFDEMFLHQTASDPSMPKPRFAVECWLFGGSCFPGDYAPIAI